MTRRRRAHGEWSSNDWRRGADPAGISDFELSASIVVPCRGYQARLEAVLEAIARQDYPTSLITVVVVDDGSPDPLDPQLPAGLDVTVHRPWHDSRGAGAARAAGAALHADADVVVYLDADMLPERDWLTAHMRWHHARTDAAVVGFRRHVAQTSMSATQVAGVEMISELFEGTEFFEPDWIEQGWNASNDGFRDPHEVWRLVSSGNLSVARALQDRSGGFDPDYWAEWGGEDNEFGYRLYVAGALVIPERNAMAWHLGVGTSHGAAADRARDRSRLRLSLRVPSTLLPRSANVIPETPRFHVRLRCRTSSADHVFEYIDQILGALGSEIGVTLEMDRDAGDADFMDLLVGRDGRVRQRPTAAERDPWSFALVSGWCSVESCPPDAIVSALGEVREHRTAHLELVDGSTLVGQLWLTRLKNLRADAATDLNERGAFRISSVDEWR